MRFVADALGVRSCSDQKYKGCPGIARTLAATSKSLVWLGMQFVKTNVNVETMFEYASAEST